MFNILPFKKSLGFASIIILASMSAGWQAHAMEERHENPNGRRSLIGEKLVDEGQLEDPEILNNLGLKYREHGEFQLACEYFKKAAKQGSPDAHNNLGVMHRFGEGVIVSESKALKYFKLAAALDYPISYSNLGIMYRDGVGVPQSDIEALNLFRKAAALGHKESQQRAAEVLFNMAGKLFEQEDFAGALELSKDEELENFASAQFNIYLMLRGAEDGSQDHVEALKRLEKAADLGMTEAQYALGTVHMKNQRFSEALVNFKNAAKKNFPQAWYNIGIILRDGLTGKKNGTQALRSFKQAVKYAKPDERKGIAVALCSIADMYLEGDGIPKSEEEALSYFEKAAGLGLEEARRSLASTQHEIGRRHLEGEGVPKNPTTALKWLEEADKNGHLEAKKGIGIALHNIGSNHLNGEGTPKDAIEAIKWFKKAKKSGLVEAKSSLAMAHYNLGVMNLQGEGVPQNDTEALKHFKKSAALGYAQAQKPINILIEKMIRGGNYKILIH
ncbi:MAG TPA: tetratricopeptide repeat protein [Alphaproteobacteria bacterium]|nr:tetratricopeptide repeat protein [Alphaproteobacteria bacterium]